MKVVLLHAFPLDERMWEQQRWVPSSHDVVAPHLYDLGGNSIDTWAGRILEETSGELAAVGASMGGYVALAMARQAPERISALLLAGSRATASSQSYVRHDDVVRTHGRGGIRRRRAGVPVLGRRRCARNHCTVRRTSSPRSEGR